MLWHVLISLAEDSHFSCALTVSTPTKRHSGSDYSPFALAHDTPSCACCRDRQGHSRQALVESVDMFGAFLTVFGRQGPQVEKSA